MNLNGKVALITGAGSGIGAATAKRLVADGAKVCVADIRRDVLEQTASSLPSGSFVTCTGDVSNFEDVERMVETTLAFGSKIDILVNSAGIDPSGPEVSSENDLWQKILAVNLTGPHLTMKTAIPHMITAGGGSIVNISSLSAIRFIAGRAAYSSSKGGLISLSQAVAVEYGPARIRCNVICPGAIRTPMFEKNTLPLAQILGKDPEWIFAKFTSFSPLRRIGRPDEIASICSFLAGEDSSLLTGGVLVADGGTSIVDANGAAISTLFPLVADDAPSSPLS
jgi:meso-butanediol dehydrogenase / (S,S)-butanediol dehydrogenase / diacetyl reductase